MQQLEPRIDPDRIYTPEDAAEVFHVPAGTIRRLVRQGSINGFYVGANVRMMGTALLVFIADGGARVQYGPGEEADPADADVAADPTKITSDAPALAEVAA